MKPSICLSIAVGEVEETLRMIDLNTIWEPNMIEIRLDHLRTIMNLEDIRESTELPLIATYRSDHTKGSCNRLNGKIREAILEACNAGFDYADLDLSTPSLHNLTEKVKEAKVGLIISHHDYKGTPSRSCFKRILKDELNLKPEVCKIVGTAKNYADNLAYLNFVSETRGVKLVCFGMGRKGTPSRILSPLVGGAFTYASPHMGSKSAPGQLSISEMRNIYSLMEVAE